MTTPRIVKDIRLGAGSNPRYLTAVGNTLFFRANDGANGYALWKTDGTTEGTILVKDIFTGTVSPGPGLYGPVLRDFTAVGNTLFFRADDGSGEKLWKSDGTEGGTVRVSNVNPEYLTAVGNTLFFRSYDSNHGIELWKSDGTASGTVLVKDINPGVSNSYLGGFKAVGNTLFFAANDGTSGREIWKTDGTAAGTVRVADIDPGASGSSPGFFTPIGNTLFFVATNGTSGYGLWKTDGTDAGTRLVKVINPGSTTNDIGGLTAVGNTLFFSASDGVSGRELWKTNGTAEGTVLVKDILSGSSSTNPWNPSPSSNPQSFTAVGNTLFFTAYDDVVGGEIWRSDGTESGTLLVKNIIPDTPSSRWLNRPSHLFAAGNTLFFTAYDTEQPSYGNMELWKSDGTQSGTQEVADIYPGDFGSFPSELTLVGNTLFFTANHPVLGPEVFALDIGIPNVGNLGTLNEHLSSSTFTLNPGESKSFEITLPAGRLQPGRFSIDSYDLFFKTSGVGTGIFLYNERNEPIYWENVTPGSTVRVEVRNTSGSSTNTLLDAYLWKINGRVEEAVDNLLNNSDSLRVVDSKTVSIYKYQKAFSSADFDDSWIISHGWNDSPGDEKFLTLASDIASQKGEVILVNWEDAAATRKYPGDALLEPQNAAYWINDVANFVTHTISDIWGYAGANKQPSLNLIGHSLGAYLSAEIARLISEYPKNNGYKFDRLIALDPAEYIGEPYNLSNQWSALDTIRGETIYAKAFADVAQYSLALWGNKFLFNGAGEGTAAKTATQSVEVDFTSIDIPSNHGDIVKLFQNLITLNYQQGQESNINNYFKLRSEPAIGYYPEEHEAYIGKVEAGGQIGPNTYMEVGRYLTLWPNGIGYRLIRIVEGYIQNGLIYYDFNGNLTHDSDELSAKVSADGSLQFSFDETTLSRIASLDTLPHIVFVPSEGSIDISTGVAFATYLAAPFGSSIITPLTTLVVERIRLGATYSQTLQTVVDAFSLPQSVLITEYDPLLAFGRADPHALTIFVAGVALQNVIIQLTSFLKEQSGLSTAQLSQKIFSVIAARLDGQSIDFSEASVVLEIINETLASASITLTSEASDKLTLVADIIANGQQRLALISQEDPYAFMDEVVRIAQVSQGLVASALKAFAGDPDNTSLDQFSGQGLDDLIAAAYVENLLPPTVTPQSITIDELPYNQSSSYNLGDAIGVVQAFDPEGQILLFGLELNPSHYSLLDVDGDGVNAFEVDQYSGSIRISDLGDLDFERQRTFHLLATASDGLLSASAPITINLLDVEDDLMPVIHVNDGVATFIVSGIPEVGEALQASLLWDDPDSGVTGLSWQWQSSPDGSVWSPVGINSSSYLVASADQGKQLRLVVSYTDGQGFPETVTTAAAPVPLVNDGAAAFAITGTPTVGQTLTVVQSADDPDGNGIVPIFSWQASSDGSIWSTIGSNSSSYTVSPADLGRELLLQVSYTDAEGFAESLTIPYGRLEELPATADGTRFTVNDPLSPSLQITSQGSPDLVELQAAVSATLHARTSSTWNSGFVAYNAGSPTAPGTGERISVTGLGRYSFVATAILEATTAIVLEPDQNSAYFLHDTYSAFFSGLSLEPDSYGRASAQRLLNIDTITMGSAGGTSIVDLTSPDYITGSMTVHGAASGTSIVWGSGADDTYISAGSDAVIYGGLGNNTYTLDVGRETLQYRQMGGGIGATDQIRGFDPSIDRLQFWSATDQLPSIPSLANTLSSSLLAWGGHNIEFLDQPNLSLADLTILQATVI